MEKTPAKIVIDICGGPKEVAAMLGLTLARVYCFTYPKDRGGSEGRIPMKHAWALLDIAKKKGLPLKPEHFFK